MQAYIFPSQPAAAAHLPAAVDAHMAYPLAGTDVGGGLHVPSALSVTTTYFVPFVNPSNPNAWAYISDGNVSAAVGPNALAWGLPAPIALDATWFPSSGPTGATGATGATV